jgi:hypothetical protein
VGSVEGFGAAGLCADRDGVPRKGTRPVAWPEPLKGQGVSFGPKLGGWGVSHSECDADQ